MMSQVQNRGRNRLLRVTGFAVGLAGALLLGGCASGEHQTPTHRWVSFDKVSGVEYRVDNNQCARETLGVSGPRVLKTNTAAYEQYVNCMNEKGYVLTAYSDREPPR